jgi:hypothetical protein
MKSRYIIFLLFSCLSLFPSVYAAVGVGEVLDAATSQHAKDIEIEILKKRLTKLEKDLDFIIINKEIICLYSQKKMYDEVMSKEIRELKELRSKNDRTVQEKAREISFKRESLLRERANLDPNTYIRRRDILEQEELSLQNLKNTFEETLEIQHRKNVDKFNQIFNFATQRILNSNKNYLALISVDSLVINLRRPSWPLEFKNVTEEMIECCKQYENR